MDLLTIILDRGCVHLILKILSFLDSWDLEVASHVCLSWRSILHTLFWPNKILKNQLAYNISHGLKTSAKVDFELTGTIVHCGLRNYPLKHSNFYSFWFLTQSISHCDSYSKGKKCYVLEEWILFQNFSRIKCCKVEDKELDDAICADYRNGVLAVGCEKGEIRLYQHRQITALNCISVIKTHSKEVLSILMTDKLLVSCSQDCSLTVLKFSKVEDFLNIGYRKTVIIIFVLLVHLAI